MEHDPQKVLYSEVQRFSPLLIMPFVLLFVVAIVLEAHMLVRPLVDSENPWPDWTLPLSIAGIVINICITVMLLVTRLQIRLEPDALYIRFFPFHLRFRRIEFDAISLIYPRTYQPMSEFGGYGIRWSKGGRAYNVSGNRGVQLEFTNGRKLLIGSQRADEFTTAVQEAVLHSRISRGQNLAYQEPPAPDPMLDDLNADTHIAI